MISRVLDFLAENPLSRAVARVRKKGNVRCRSLQAARAFALPAALSLHLANDHQMTPPLFAGAFRAFGPFAPLTAARLSGTPSAALRPKASRRAGLRSELTCVEKHAACREGEFRAGLFRTSYSAKRTASLPSGHRTKASRWPGIFRSSSPGDRTLGKPRVVSPALLESEAWESPPLKSCKIASFPNEQFWL